MQILPKKMYSEKFYEKFFTVNNAKNAKLRKEVFPLQKRK